MADLHTGVQTIPGIGPQRAKALEKLGISTLGDLIAYFPHRGPHPQGHGPGEGPLRG